MLNSQAIITYQCWYWPEKLANCVQQLLLAVRDHTSDRGSVCHRCYIAPAPHLFLCPACDAVRLRQEKPPIAQVTNTLPHCSCHSTAV